MLGYAEWVARGEIAERRARRFSLRLFSGWSITLEKRTDHNQDVIMVSSEEFARLKECTENPKRPQAVLEGAELLRNLRKSSR